MKLNRRYYTLILLAQFCLFIVDFFINAISGYLKNNALMLVAFIVQDFCILLAISCLLVTFFSTYVFQAGLVEVLYERFRATLIICMLYFVLTTIFHIISLVNKWNGSPGLVYGESVALHVFFIIHRVVSPIYYYFYKRTALRISDPRFFMDVMDNKNSSVIPSNAY